MLSISKNYRPGFGLIEVLISLSIITVLLASLVSVGKTMLGNSLNVQEKAQAVRLAEEGLEIVRQIRDTNWIDGNMNGVTEWDTLVYAASGSSGSWSPAEGGKSYGILFDDDIKALHLVPTTGNGDAITIDNVKFYRKIEVANLTNLLPAGPDGQNMRGNGKKFTAKIIMPNGKEIAVSEILTNWRPAW